MSDLTRQQLEFIARARARAAQAQPVAAPEPESAGMGQLLGGLGAGIARGAANLVDLPGAIVSGAGNLAAAGARKLGAPEGFAQGIEQSLSMTPMGSGSTVRQAAEMVTGGASEYEAPGTAGEFASTIGEFLPGAALGPTKGIVGRLLQYGVLPGAASEAAGQMTEGSGLEGPARVAAALVAPMAAQGAANLGRRAITPYPGADPERLKLASVLDDFDVPVTAGQRTGSDPLRRLEGQSMRGADLMDEQAEAFTAAALRTIGETGKRATPDVLDGAAKRIGSVFDDVARGVDVTPDIATANKVFDALDIYRAGTPAANAPPIFENIATAVGASAQAGMPIAASNLQKWRGTLSRLTRSADASTRETAIGMIDALDDALGGSLTALGRADDVQKLQLARQQYRDFLAIQKAATGAGESTAAGLLSPSALRTAVKTQGIAGYAQGRRGQLGELARAGEGVIKPLPTSGTAENLRALGLTGAATSGVGAAIGGSVGGPVGAALGAAAGGLGPMAMREARMTPVMQRYLANQLVGQGAPVVNRNMTGTIASLLAGAGR